MAIKWYMRTDKAPAKAHALVKTTDSRIMFALCGCGHVYDDGFDADCRQWREVQPGESWCAGRCKRCEAATKRLGKRADALADAKEG